MATSQSNQQPSSTQVFGATKSPDEQAKQDAIARGDLDAALDALDRQQSTIHPTVSGTATATPNIGTASGTPNVGTATGTPKTGG